MRAIDRCVILPDQTLRDRDEWANGILWRLGDGTRGPVPHQHGCTGLCTGCKLFRRTNQVASEFVSLLRLGLLFRCLVHRSLHLNFVYLFSDWDVLNADLGDHEVDYLLQLREKAFIPPNVWWHKY